MKLFVMGLFVALAACGSGEKASTHNDAALQKQADVARVNLQQKADALAREASMPPAPQAKK